MWRRQRDDTGKEAMAHSRKNHLPSAQLWVGASQPCGLPEWEVETGRRTERKKEEYF